jgi:tRNA 2-selenouridine synthase
VIEFGNDQDVILIDRICFGEVFGRAQCPVSRAAHQQFRNHTPRLQFFRHDGRIAVASCIQGAVMVFFVQRSPAAFGVPYNEDCFQHKKLQKSPLTFAFMAITRVNIEEFLRLAASHPVLDVRSPGEYAHAHIPGAHALPLFSDEERKVVGTAYKQESREKAIKIGLDYFGVKMRSMVEEVEKISQQLAVGSGQSADQKDHIVLVHCWRGGMRSAGVAWLLDLYGFKVYTLAGGYKAYRHWVLQQFEKQYAVHIVGGFTGSGKTEALSEISKTRCVIDLEALANHKGSAFGNLGMPKQPTQEMFENRLAAALHAKASQYSIVHNSANGISAADILWVEDESQRIGDINIPVSFYRQLRVQPLYFLNIPFEERLDYIVKDYGKHEREKLVNTIMRIKKRLGGLETKTAINHLLEDNIRECFRVLLTYYDKFYLKSLQNRDDLNAVFNKVELEKVDAATTAATVLRLADSNRATQTVSPA